MYVDIPLHDTAWLSDFDDVLSHLSWNHDVDKFANFPRLN